MKGLGVGNGRIPRFVRPERKREAQTHSLYGSMFQSSLLLSAARQNSNSRRGLCEQTHICWKTRWRDPWKMAWTPTLLRVVAGDHATWDCKSLRWNPACRGFGRPDYCLVTQMKSVFMIPQKTWPESSGRKRYLCTRPAIVLKGE